MKEQQEKKKVEFRYEHATLEDFIYYTKDCIAVTSKDDPRTVYYYSEDTYKLPYGKYISKKFYKDTNEYYIAVYR